MKSATPKVLHEVCGRPALWHVLRAAVAARPTRVAVIVSHEADEVREAALSWEVRPGIEFVDQGEPLGTGHAVLAAAPVIEELDEVLVLAGDDPLVTGDHVRGLLKLHRATKAAATILTTLLDDPTGFGRVMRDGARLVGILEESDAPPEIRAIREVSTLVYAFRREDLLRALPLVGRENRQREYYLPDVLRILRDKGETVSALRVDLGGALGANHRAGLAKVSAVMRRRIVEEHMANGVTFVDPEAAYVDVDVRIGRDSVIYPATHLEGATRIGEGCTVGPATRIVDSTLADGAEVTYSVVKGSRIGPRASVGPFASLRPGTVMDEGAKAGTFVEVKKSRIGKGSKVPHLSYVGDATIGAGANVGAGTVTVNYDGYEKHPTVIGDDAAIGSDTMLVAPVKVGKGAVTGAGSVITKDVPPGALAVERTEQRVVRGYAERKRAKHEARAHGEDGGQDDDGGGEA